MGIRCATDSVHKNTLHKIIKAAILFASLSLREEASHQIIISDCIIIDTIDASGFPTLGIGREPAFLHPVFLLEEFVDGPEAGEGGHS